MGRDGRYVYISVYMGGVWQEKTNARRERRAGGLRVCSCDRGRAEGHDLLIEELLELFAADVVLVH